MGTTSLAGGVKLPEELAGDPVEAAWSTAKKGINAGRIVVPGLLSLADKVASSASASSALFVIGTANVLLLYVNIWMALGGAYGAVRENARVKGTLMGFATGFGFRLTGDYDYNELAWGYRSSKPTKFQREVDELFKRSFNAGLTKGSYAAIHLKPGHKKAIIQELDKKVEGRYPTSFEKGQTYGSFIYAGFEDFRNR